MLSAISVLCYMHAGLVTAVIKQFPVKYILLIAICDYQLFYCKHFAIKVTYVRKQHIRISNT